MFNGAGVETIRTATIEVPVVKTAEQENLPALVVPPSTPEETTAAPQAVQPSAPQAFGNTSNPLTGTSPFTGNSIQTSFSASSKTTPTQSTTTSNVLWGGAAAAMLGATLAEWQRQREEEAARLAALRNSGGGGEEGDSDAADKKRMKVLARVNPAYASALAKEQSTRAAIAKVTAQEQKAWTRENTLKVEATQAYKESENKGQYLKQELQNIRVEEAEYRAEKAEIAAQNREEKFDNLIVAEAEMDAVKPVTPYVVSSYLDKEEETWLKGNESQRAWAAVNAQEEEALDIKSEPVATVIPLPHPTSAQPDNEGNSKTPTPTSTPIPIDIATPPEYKTPANTLTPSNTLAPPNTPIPLETVVPILTLTPSPTPTPPPPTPTNPNDKPILEWVVEIITEDNVPGTYHYPAEPNLPTGGGGMPGGLNDTNAVD